MDTLQITLPSEATDKSLPKLGELAFKWPTDGKGMSVAAGTNNTGKVRSEGCQITRTFPTPQVGPTDELTYVGSAISVMPSSVVENESFVFLGNKNELTILQFGNHTAAVDLVHGSLEDTALATLNSTWLMYKGQPYPIEKLPWATLTTLENSSDLDHGMPKNLQGDFANVDLSNVQVLKVGNQDIYGNLDSDFLEATSLTQLSLANNQLLRGNVTGLANCIALTSLTLNTCHNISGTLEALLDAMVAAGRTSGTMTIGLIQSAITYNGSVPSGTLTATFSDSGWTIA